MFLNTVIVEAHLARGMSIDDFAASVTRCAASSYDYPPRLSRFLSVGQRRIGAFSWRG